MTTMKPTQALPIPPSKPRHVVMGLYVGVRSLLESSANDLHTGAEKLQHCNADQRQEVIEALEADLDIFRELLEQLKTHAAQL